MTLNEEWVTETARLIREREHAQQMLRRWQQKLDDANASLVAVALRQNNEVVQNTEQVPVPE